MQDACGDCLRKIQCEITGASCPKLDALIHKLDTNGRTTMTNPTKKPVTETSVKETDVPAQATAKTWDLKGDKVLDNAGKVLFAGTPEEVKNWLLKQPTMIYAVRQMKNNDLVVSTEYVQEGSPKPSTLQRAKTAVEKFSKNQKAMFILGASIAAVGLAVKNSRKVVQVDALDEEDDTSTGVDETPDSL